MSAEKYVDGVLRERWDDGTRTHTRFDAGGKQTSVRPYSPGEVESLTAAAARQVPIDNRATIEAQAATALAANKAFVAIAAPTNAQNAAQIKALTRQSNGIIRLLLNRLDATD